MSNNTNIIDRTDLKVINLAWAAARDQSTSVIVSSSAGLLFGAAGAFSLVKGEPVIASAFGVAALVFGANAIVRIRRARRMRRFARAVTELSKFEK